MNFFLHIFFPLFFVFIFLFLYSFYLSKCETLEHLNHGFTRAYPSDQWARGKNTGCEFITGHRIALTQLEGQSNLWTVGGNQRTQNHIQKKPVRNKTWNRAVKILSAVAIGANRLVYQ